jgi:hypothetical protein
MLSFVPKFTKTHMRASVGQKIFLGSLALAIRRKMEKGGKGEKKKPPTTLTTLTTD